jgi:hypothetical protein
MSEINYFKKIYSTRWCGKWYGPVACERYKWIDDVSVNDMDSLHVKRIILNDWQWVILIYFACQENYIKWLTVGYPYISIVDYDGS